MNFSPVNIMGTMPEIYLTVLGCLLFLMEPFVPAKKRSLLGVFAIFSLVFAMIATFGLNGKGLPLYQGLYIVDPF